MTASLSFSAKARSSCLQFGPSWDTAFHEWMRGHEGEEEGDPGESRYWIWKRIKRMTQAARM